MSAGTLYLVATPIGNLDDITLRALRVLREADVIAAEDTRHTGRLLRHFQITTPAVSYHAHNERARVAGLLGRLRAGQMVALVTDAGTPGISDPGAVIVGACVREGIRVIPIPGASAPLAALTASGLPADRFLYLGFLSRKQGERRRLLESIRREPGTLVVFEAPSRVRATLDALREALGDRPAVVARELTKVHEEFARGSLSALAERFSSVDPRGEVTVVVAGAGAVQDEDPPKTEDDLDIVLLAMLRAGRPVRDAATLAAERFGVPRRAAYRRALELRDARSDDAPAPLSQPR